jgi:thioredoxin
VSGLVQNVTDATFVAQVIEASRVQPVLVDFWADWCAPCLRFGRVIEAVAEQLAGSLTVVKLDIDTNPETAQAVKIRSVPRTLLYFNGEVIGDWLGLMSKDELTRKLRTSLEGSS